MINTIILASCNRHRTAVVKPPFVMKESTPREAVVPGDDAPLTLDDQLVKPMTDSGLGEETPPPPERREYNPLRKIKTALTAGRDGSPEGALSLLSILS